jgi:hypothetical protein
MSASAKIAAKTGVSSRRKNSVYSWCVPSYSVRTSIYLLSNDEHAREVNQFRFPQRLLDFRLHHRGKYRLQLLELLQGFGILPDRQSQIECMSHVTLLPCNHRFMPGLTDMMI